jgi:hypothetical protein
MIHNAVLLLWFKTVPPLPFPMFFGVSMMLLGVVCITGLLFDLPVLRLLFAAIGCGVRVAMMLFYITRDWHDPAWGGFFVSAVTLIIVLVRIILEEGPNWLVKIKGINE